jgi:hypothetical protein
VPVRRGELERLPHAELAGLLAEGLLQRAPARHVNETPARAAAFSIRTFHP